MAIIKDVRGFTPKIGKNCFLAETAAIIGDVTIGDDCSIWYGTVLRGDVNTITIGNKVNIQDGAVIHTLYKRSVTKIGNNVSIGHNATIHGATIEDNCLIGMGAVVMESVVGENCIIAAGSVLPAGKTIESGSMVMGVPAKAVRKLTSEEIAGIKENAEVYVKLAKVFAKECKEI